MSDTAAVIQARLLGNISGEYDKTEGSFFYDVEMPVAIELEGAYKEQDAILDKGFASTASGEYLDKIVIEQGLSRKPAAASSAIVIITGSAGASIAVGDLVSTDSLNFKAIESVMIATGETTMSVPVECTTEGTIGNVITGAIKYFPVTIPGLTSVTNQDAVTNGYDAETDAELRKRYFEKVQSPSTSGNSAAYKSWAKMVTGVGDARIVPLWNGNGTVKVIIINSNKHAADSALIDAVANYIETERPIGATVTVVSASEVAINVTVVLSLQAGRALAEIKNAIEHALIEHLAEIAFVDSYVSHAKVGSIILSTEGVLDYSGLTLNGSTGNITIADTAVAILGTVTVSE